MTFYIISSRKNYRLQLYVLHAYLIPLDLTKHVQCLDSRGTIPGVDCGSNYVYTTRVPTVQRPSDKNLPAKLKLTPDRFARLIISWHDVEIFPIAPIRIPDDNSGTFALRFDTPVQTNDDLKEMEMRRNNYNTAIKPCGCCKHRMQRLKLRTGRMFGYCSRMQPPSQKITCILNVYMT